MPSFTRTEQVNLSVTPYYHCISRCVRRSFLCGTDAYSGKNYDHRKGWFVERLRLAAEGFCIDVCAFAIMSNHFHVVLRIDAERGAGLSDNAVLLRYGKFFPLAAKAVRELPASVAADRIGVFRERLTDLGWFMRVINEHVSRRANKEDECTGRFWEGRFKSQALLDDAAVYTCMSYVDLNPVRAGLADSLEGAEFTSIQQRLREAAGRKSGGRRRGGKKPAHGGKPVPKPVPLAPLRGEGRGGARTSLELRFEDYVAQLEWTGRALGRKSGGTLRGAPPAMLNAMKVDADAWLRAMRGAGLARLTLFGAPASIAAEAERRGRRWLHGKGAARSMFRRAG